MDKVTVFGTEISHYQKNEEDYISLTDMVKNFGDDAMIYSWMRNRNTLEFIGIWEELHNPNFNSNEFVTFKNQAGLNSYSCFKPAEFDGSNYGEFTSIRMGVLNG